MNIKDFSPTRSTFLAFALLFALFTAAAQNGDYRLKTIVIDAGHGGKDPGTHGKIAKEKTVALQIALKLGRILNKNMPDIKVIYTRDKDVFIPLRERANIANRAHADLFISIHCNAGAAKWRGTETYAMGLHVSEGNLSVAKRENSVIYKEENYLEAYEGFNPESPDAYILFSLIQNAYLQNSLRFASKVESQFKNKNKRHSRGVKQAGFLVLWRTAMPAVLIETGFLSNTKDELYLTNKKKQVYIASSIYRAIKEYRSEIEKITSN